MTFAPFWHPAAGYGAQVSPGFISKDAWDKLEAAEGDAKDDAEEDAEKKKKQKKEKDASMQQPSETPVTMFRQ